MIAVGPAGRARRAFIARLLLTDGATCLFCYYLRLDAAGMSQPHLRRDAPLSRLSPPRAHRDIAGSWTRFKPFPLTSCLVKRDLYRAVHGTAVRPPGEYRQKIRGSRRGSISAESSAPSPVQDTTISEDFGGTPLRASVRVSALVSRSKARSRNASDRGFVKPR